MESLQSPGCLLLCTLSLEDAQIVARLSAKREEEGRQADLEDLMGQLLDVAEKTLDTADILKDAVIGFRIYHPAELLGDVTATSRLMSRALNHAKERGAFFETPISCVPVLAIGSSPEMKAAIFVELVAFSKSQQ